MTTEESYLIRGKCIITISIALMILSIGLFLLQNLSISKENYNISFEQINTKNMSTVNVAFKTGAESVLTSKVKLKETPYKIEQTLVETKEPLQAVQLSNPVVKQQAWFMPTVQGTITTYPRYGHYALDITSPRGRAETIYPVADGTVAAIVVAAVLYFNERASMICLTVDMKTLVLMSRGDIDHRLRLLTAGKKFIQKRN